MLPIGITGRSLSPANPNSVQPLAIPKVAAAADHQLMSQQPTTSQLPSACTPWNGNQLHFHQPSAQPSDAPIPWQCEAHRSTFFRLAGPPLAHHSQPCRTSKQNLSVQASGLHQSKVVSARTATTSTNSRSSSFTIACPWHGPHRSAAAFLQAPSGGTLHAGCPTRDLHPDRFPPPFPACRSKHTRLQPRALG